MATQGNGTSSFNRSIPNTTRLQTPGGIRRSARINNPIHIPIQATSAGDQPTMTNLPSLNSGGVTIQGQDPISLPSTGPTATNQHNTDTPTDGNLSDDDIADDTSFGGEDDDPIQPINQTGINTVVNSSFPAPRPLVYQTPPRLTGMPTGRQPSARPDGRLRTRREWNEYNRNKPPHEQYWPGQEEIASSSTSSTPSPISRNSDNGGKKSVPRTGRTRSRSRPPHRSPSPGARTRFNKSDVFCAFYIVLILSILISNLGLWLFMRSRYAIFGPPAPCALVSSPAPFPRSHSKKYSIFRKPSFTTSWHPAVRAQMEQFAERIDADPWLLNNCILPESIIKLPLVTCQDRLPWYNLTAAQTLWLNERSEWGYSLDFDITEDFNAVYHTSFELHELQTSWMLADLGPASASAHKNPKWEHRRCNACIEVNRQLYRQREKCPRESISLWEHLFGKQSHCFPQSQDLFKLRPASKTKAEAILRRLLGDHGIQSLSLILHRQPVYKEKENDIEIENSHAITNAATERMGEQKDASNAALQDPFPGSDDGDTDTGSTTTTLANGREVRMFSFGHDFQWEPAASRYTEVADD